MVVAPQFTRSGRQFAYRLVAHFTSSRARYGYGAKAGTHGHRGPDRLLSRDGAGQRGFDTAACRRRRGPRHASAVGVRQGHLAVKLDRYLIPGEQRVVVVRRHPAMFAPVATAAFLAVMVALLETGLSSSASRLVWLVALALVAWLAWRLLEWNANVFIVTNQRVLLITGLTTRRVAMLPLRRVQDMTYKRSPLGRALGYGEFVIEWA